MTTPADEALELWRKLVWTDDPMGLVVAMDQLAVQTIAAALAGARAEEKERIAHLFEMSDGSPSGYYDPLIANRIRKEGAP